MEVVEASRDRLWEALRARGYESQINVLKNFCSPYATQIYIVVEVLNLFADNNVTGKLIDTEDMVIMAKLASWSAVELYEVYSRGEDYLRRMISGGRDEIYTVEVSGKVRYATQGEIANGVEELSMQYKYFLDEETDYRYLKMLLYLVYGRLGQLSELGYTIEYIRYREPRTSLRDIVSMCSYEMAATLNWVHDGGFDRARSIVNKSIKKKFKYPTYASDEVVPEIPVRQLINDVDNKRRYLQSEEEYLLYKMCRRVVMDSRVKLQPMQIQRLRQLHTTLANEDRQEAAVLEIEKISEELTKARYSGYISPDDFVYRIIDSLNQWGYKRCSVKQRAIIEEAYNSLRCARGEIVAESKVEKKQDENQEQVTVESENDFYYSLLSGFGDSEIIDDSFGE